MDATQKVTVKIIKLSQATNALIKDFLAILKKPAVEEQSKITVSKTVSFFAFLYEKVRNVVEYRDEHLIRRAAIERILKRRLLLNPQGDGEAENLIRELLWARYFAEGTLGSYDIELVQAILTRYLSIRRQITLGQANHKRSYYDRFLFDLLTSEIEETLDRSEAQTNTLFTFFIYQTLHQKVKIEGVLDQDKDAFFYAAIEKGFAKSDMAYLRFHLFTLSHQSIGSMHNKDVSQFIPKLPELFEKIDSIVNSPAVDKLAKYVRSQMPSYRVLFNIFTRNQEKINSVLSHKESLWAQVDLICRERYQLISGRLTKLAIRSLIYIFLTKMVFALILEYPLSLRIYGEVNYISLILNSIFPPFLMLVIIGLVKVPGLDNTKRIFSRIVDIINSDISFESKISYIVKKPRVRKPLLIFGFTVFYSLTFVVTFAIIYELLSLLQFNLISQAIFIFFVTIVSFFGYRVTQIAKEYKLSERESFFSPFVDFFFMPILSVGKFLSSEIARLNFFIVILDFLIEAPFKLIFEIIEEWISFVRARKEEIV